VTASDDLIQQVEEDRPRHWSENLIFNSSDRASGISVYVHMSRMAPHADIWEGNLVVYLPDGETLLVSRTFGQEPTHRQAASSGSLTFACDEPMEKWSLRYDGMVRRVTRPSVAAAPVGDGPVERFTMDFALTGLHEAWVIDKDMLAKQSWGRYHLEQACRIQGEIVIDGKIIPYDCEGFRDHTYGARNYGPLTEEAWINCTFPSGRIIMALLVEEDGNPSLSTGFIVEDGVMRPMVMDECPALTYAGGSPADLEMAFTDGDGKQTVASVHQTHVVSYWLHSPVGWSLGVSYDDPDSVVLLEGPATFQWEGEEGLGWLERLRRVRDLENPNEAAVG
jgi:hypothetical protein